MFHLPHCVLSSICLKLRKISMNPFQLCKLPPAPQLYFPYLCCYFTVSYFLPKSAKSIWYFSSQAYLENIILPHFPHILYFQFQNSSLFVCILPSSCLWTTKWVASHLMMCQKIATWRHEKCCYPLICYKPHSLPFSSSLESPLMLSNDDFSSASSFLLWSFMINDFFYVYSLVRIICWRIFYMQMIWSKI